MTTSDLDCVTVTCVTHRGRIREVNEDCYGVLGMSPMHVDGQIEAISMTGGLTLVVVADGLGGHPAGDVASDLVVKTVMSAAPFDASGLVTAVQRADAELVFVGNQDPALKGMGSTVATVMLLRNRLVVANVGDSEVFAVAKSGLVPLTVRDVPRDKLLFRSSKSDVLTQHLGSRSAPDDLDVHRFETDVGTGFRLLVCTDGLTGAVPLGEIDDILRQYRGGVAAGVLLDEAMRAGAPDNLTLVIVESAASVQ